MKTSLTLLLTAACAVAAQANTYVDFDRIVTELKEDKSPHSSTFNLVNDDWGADTYGPSHHGVPGFWDTAGSTLGFVANPLYTITSAVMTFGVWSGDSDVEQYAVKLGDPSSAWMAPTKTSSFSGGYDIYSLTLGSAALTDLADGLISYWIKIVDTGEYTYTSRGRTKTGDKVYDNAWLKWAKLTVTTETQRVSDSGATIALLGAGLLGLAALRRRLA